MIRFLDLKVARGTDTIVEATQVTCEAGTCSVVVGPSGGGKTSLLMALAGAGHEVGLQVSGKVQMADGRICDISDLQQPVCSLVLQNAALYDELTVQDNLDIVSTTHAGKSVVDHDVLSRLLDGIDPSAMPNTLSGGERQRVAIVRSLLRGARICLMDEPNAGLDPRRSRELSNLIKQLCAAGIHVLVTTHHPQLFAEQADLFYVLDNGALIELQGTPGDTFANIEGLADKTARADGAIASVRLEGARRRNWAWEFFARDIWSHCLAPAALLYIGTACALIAFTLGYVSVSRYPFSPMLLDATIERIAAELGDGFYRFTIPLIVGILVAARSGSLATMDLLQKQSNGSTLALEQIQVPVRRYRDVGLVSAISLASVLLYLFGVVASLYMLGISIASSTNIPFQLVMDFVVEDIFRPSIRSDAWTWVLAKMLLSGASVALISLLVGRQTVGSGMEIRNYGALAVLMSVLCVIALQTALILLEMAW